MEVKARHSGPAWVFIRPEGVSVFSLHSAETAPTAAGMFAGRVLQMTAEGEHVKVLLDVGMPLRTLMTRDEAARSGIMVCDQVRVAIDPEAVQVAQ